MFKKFALVEIREQVVVRLQKAPSHLTYHNLAHTLDVAEQAVRIAMEEKVSKYETLLLEIAALYHDIGYLKGPQNHEERGCKIFSEEAAKWNFSPQEIKKITGIIMATKVPQSPKNKLEEIICDADLDYLGRDDFFELGKGLKKEYLHFGIVNNDEEWEEKQLAFLQKHHYFTKSSNALREPQKQKNLRMLMA